MHEIVSKSSVVCALAATGLLAGCGQRGPLTLPEKHPGTVVTRPAPASVPDSGQPAPDDKDKKKSETDQQP